MENLRDFCKGKKPDDLIFRRHNFNTSTNSSQSIAGVAAKVFRTFHATTVVKPYLNAHDKFPKEAPSFDKLYQAKMANLEALLGESQEDSSKDVRAIAPE